MAEAPLSPDLPALLAAAVVAAAAPIEADAEAAEQHRAATALAVLVALLPAAAESVPVEVLGESVLPSAWAEALAQLPAWRAARFGAAPWSAREADAWQASVDQALAVAAEQGSGQAWLTSQGAANWVLASEPRHAAALSDVATLLFDGPRWFDEGQRLDVAVRWWQAARRAGVPLDADFGEVWHQLEWTAAVQLLLAVADPAAPTEREPARVQQLQALALRYGGIKPWLRLFEPLFGQGPASGYTF